ncbi:3-ketoacyl-CoA thiolase [Klebsiella michiganensis]|uniref:3-ketoacyl-CoA thiolase n=1 Tax=Klebsiella michiganensis TaxID=1134687 RepID=A0A7H4PI94_9ENTR|nr:3-ketoacyl-CoA thiolase [Klebsiella michiganensis]
MRYRTAKKATRLFATDEHPRDTPREKLAALRPAFKADGVVTAANSSGINDGAAALVMMTRQQAEQRGLTPRMRIRGWAVAGCGAEIMGFGPLSRYPTPDEPSQYGCSRHRFN